jgi:hypothetical protein
MISTVPGASPLSLYTIPFTVKERAIAFTKAMNKKLRIRDNFFILF